MFIRCCFIVHIHTYTKKITHTFSPAGPAFEEFRCTGIPNQSSEDDDWEVVYFDNNLLSGCVLMILRLIWYFNY